VRVCEVECTKISTKLSDHALTQRTGNLEDNHRLPAFMLPLAAVADKRLTKKKDHGLILKATWASGLVRTRFEKRLKSLSLLRFSTVFPQSNLRS
jgi:hypothetical protein